MAGLALLLVLAAPDGETYRQDVAYALTMLEERCGHFFEPKGIRWAKVRRQFTKEAKSVGSPEEHWMLLWRLVVRLKDGHADVRTTEKTKDLKWPGLGLDAGPRMEWVSDGKRVWVKRCWGDAASAGIRPGMEVVKVDGTAARKWLERRIEELGDLHALPTEHYARHFACTWGLAGPEGSRLSLELRDPETRKTKKATLMRESRGLAPAGPAFFPEGLQALDRVSYGTLPSGHGYVHLRDVPGDLPAKLDTILAALGPVPGLVLDCRACGGGGTDHDEVFGRFLPKGRTVNFSGDKTLTGTSDRPYLGPMVVIVDAAVRSAGETVSGMFKEDGRAYLIGPEPTAGMSSGKTSIELPSGLFTLYVSVSSNKGRYNRGKGIEGIGIPPHETVPYDPGDFAAGIDTQIRHAVEILEKGIPGNEVPYKPDRFGWEPPSK